MYYVIFAHVVKHNCIIIGIFSLPNICGCFQIYKKKLPIYNKFIETNIGISSSEKTYIFATFFRHNNWFSKFHLEEKEQEISTIAKDIKRHKEINLSMGFLILYPGLKAVS